MHASRSVVMLAAAAVALSLLAGCSRERQDWRSAEAADSIESYGEFLRKHPESELATRAQERVAQLEEERDWQATGTLDTLEAYQQFLTRHPQGKWAEEARIRIESFAMAEVPSAEAAPSGDARPSDARPPAARAVAPAAAQSPQPARQAGPRQEPVPAAPHQVPRAAASGVPPAAGAGPRYGVQLGAFSDESRARREWQRLAGRFPRELRALEPRFHSAQTASGRLVRLQAETANESRARALCATLRKSGQGCVVVLPARR